MTSLQCVSDLGATRISSSVSDLLRSPPLVPLEPEIGLPRTGWGGWTNGRHFSGGNMQMLGGVDLDFDMSFEGCAGC